MKTKADTYSKINYLPHKNLPQGPEPGCGRCLQSQERCRCQTAAAWSGSVSACSAGEPRRWPAAAGWPARRKRKRTVRCCNAAVEMALHSGLVGNDDDSHWSLGRKQRRRGEKLILSSLLVDPFMTFRVP